MVKGDSRHVLDFTNSELGNLAWLAGGIYIEQNRFPNTVFPRQCFLLIEDNDIRNKVRTKLETVTNIFYNMRLVSNRSILLQTVLFIKLVNRT